MSAVIGVVKRAFPLRELRAAGDALEPSEAFGPGSGPCGVDAAQVVAVTVESGDSFQSTLVFFYDAWAARVQFLRRHFKLNISGGGLVALQWEVGEDTEEQCACVVVAERTLLSKALKRSPRLFRFPTGTSIEIAYEEPRRLPESDQLTYLPPKWIKQIDLHRTIPTLLPPTIVRGRVKRTLQQATGSASKYRYTALSDLVNGNADVYGVVVNASLPKRTGGRDFCMSVNIIDETCPHRSDAMPVNIFYPLIEEMPKTLYAGDVIRFHKLQIQQFQDKAQGVATSRKTRYIVVREGVGGKLDVQTCSKTWTFEASDEARARELIKWAKSNMSSDRTLPPKCPKPLLLSETQGSGFVDVAVRVLWMDPQSEPPRLIVWDGSGDASKSDLLVTELAKTRGVEVPEKGIMVELTIDSCWSAIQEMGFDRSKFVNDHWCRFRNVAVTASDSSNAYSLRFREVSSLLLLPNYAVDVKDRLALLGGVQDRTSPTESSANLPPTSRPESPTAGLNRVQLVVPEFILKSVPVSTLAAVAKSNEVPRKYHCFATFKAMWPSEMVKISKPKPGTQREHVYSFVLTVHDNTGTLDVIVYGNDAEHFLHGIPACDLNTSTSSKSLLEQRLGALLSSSIPQHCCIKSYRPPQPPGSTEASAIRYRLFDTLLQR